MSQWPENFDVMFRWARCFPKQIQGSDGKEDMENAYWVERKQ